MKSLSRLRGVSRTGVGGLVYLARSGIVAVFVTALLSLLNTPTLSRATSLPVYGNAQTVYQAPQIGFADLIAAVDFNCDGLLDVALTRLVFQTPQVFEIAILVNDARGGFIDGTTSIIVGPVPRTQNARNVVVADFNGDGRPDIFIADHGQDISPFPGYQNTLLLSTPDCRLTDATTNLPRQSDYTHSVAAADIDGDGDIDLFLGNMITMMSKVPPQILLNDGTGRFTVAENRLPGQVTDVSRLFQFASSLFVDVNNDGAPDLVLGGNNTDSLVLLNDGTGHFIVLPNALPPKPWPAAFALYIVSADLNRDGYADLVISFTKSTPKYEGRYLQILINNGDGTFRDETTTRLPQADNNDAWIRVIHLFDIDGDGSLDMGLCTAGPKCEKPFFYLNDGSGIFAPLPAGFGGFPGCGPFVPLDVDGDGGRDFYSVIGARSGFPEFHFVMRDIGPPLVPGIPTGVSASQGRFVDKIRVSWDYVWGAVSYEVRRSTSPAAEGSLIGTTRTTTFEDTTASATTTYYYFVRARNPAGASAPGGPARGSRGLRILASVNQSTFAVGQTLVAGGGITNPGFPGLADFYVGILRPDNSIQFFTNTGIAFGNLADLTSFRPIAAGVPLVTPFSVTQPNFYTHQWTASELRGAWVFFLLAVKAGALSDGVVTDDDVLGLATAPFSFP